MTKAKKKAATKMVADKPATVNTQADPDESLHDRLTQAEHERDDAPSQAARRQACAEIERLQALLGIG